jgi:hypothetical protein
LSLDDRNRELGRERAAAVAKAVMAFETLQTKPRERERERERERAKKENQFCLLIRG